MSRSKTESPVVTPVDVPVANSARNGLSRRQFLRRVAVASSVAIAVPVIVLACAVGGCTQRSSVGWAQTSPTILPTSARSSTFQAAPIGLASYGDEPTTSQDN